MASRAPPSAAAAALWPPERIRAVAEQYGTPLYAYDGAEVKRRIDRVRDAFGPNTGLLYAVKANPHPDLLRAVRPWVDGLDVASEGEVDTAIQAEYPLAHLRLAGPAKTPHLLRRAVADQIVVSVETPDELRELADNARALGRRAQVVLRLEPTEPRRAFAVQMGRRDHPFGLDPEETKTALAVVAASPEVLTLRGMHVYGGAQCRSVRAWLRYAAHVLDLVAPIARAGFSLEEINVGGGFGIETTGGPELDVAALGPQVQQLWSKFPTGPRFVLELGRYLVADAGVYITRVRRTKTRADEATAILDGGIHHLWAAAGQLGPRPPIRVIGNCAGPRRPTHLTGPLCTPLDALGTVNASLAPGDLVAFDRVGAYGATLSPNRFLGHGEPQEVWIDATV